MVSMSWALAVPEGTLNVHISVCMARLLPRLLGGFVNHHACQHVDGALPWLFGKRLACLVVARLPAPPDPGARKVDILGVVLAVEPRRQEAHEMHERTAAIFR